MKYRQKRIANMKTDSLLSGDSDLKLKRLSVMQADNVKSVVQDVGCIDIEIEMLAYRDLDGIAVGLLISNSKGDGMLHTMSNINCVAQTIGKGNKTIRFTLPPLLLTAGNYSVTVGAYIPNVHTYFLEHDILSFQVETANSEMHRYPENAWKGVLNPQIGEWSFLSEVSQFLCS